jgi:hypothetical protein
MVLLDHLEKTVEYASNFSDIVGQTSSRSDAIEFVEKIDAARLVQRLEDEAKLGGGLTHEFGNQTVKSNDEQR